MGGKTCGINCAADSADNLFKFINLFIYCTVNLKILIKAALSRLFLLQIFVLSFCRILIAGRLI